MRILYFTRDYSPHDHRFLSGLAKTGHAIYSLRLGRRGPQLEDRPLPDAVEQVAWRGGLTPTAWKDLPAIYWDLKRVIRQVKPDLIHAGPIQGPALLAALSGFHPLVSMSWGSDLLKDADKNGCMRWATRTTLRRSDILIGDCDAVRRKAIDLGFPSDRIVIFPWGVDLAHFSPGPAELETKTNGQFTLLSLRSWQPIYGVDVVVRAFIQAANQASNLHLLLLGSGSLAPQINAMLKSTPAIELVTFGGQVAQKDLPRFYRSADLYLSASHSDGSSVSLMEALACGCPVLVSDIPGNREWISPDKEGWLFPDGDALALEQGILKAASLAQDRPDILTAMSGAARRIAEARADWEKNFGELLRAYDMAMALHKHHYKSL